MTVSLSTGTNGFQYLWPEGRFPEYSHISMTDICILWHMRSRDHEDC